MELYSADRVQELTSRSQFLQGSPLPGLSETEAQGLDERILCEEIEEAISALTIHKTPGPDGYPAEYYVAFLETLVLRLHALYEEVIERGTFPPETDMATIVVIPKTDPPLSTSCSNYHPISLINTEVKIYATILVTHLSSLIHSDQCGFMPHRSTRHCLWGLHEALAHRHLLPRYLALLLIDFEKAFDAVDWRYLANPEACTGALLLPFS